MNRKHVKYLPAKIAGFENLSSESKLSFGAAGGCLILGMIGFAINALTTIETTLSAFLVISAFYFLLGIINIRKGQPAYAIKQSQVSKRDELRGDDFVESAA